MWGARFMRGNLKKIYIIKEGCRDKGPGLYIGPWAFFEDVEWSEKEQIIIRGSNLKSHE